MYHIEISLEGPDIHIPFFCQISVRRCVHYNKNSYGQLVVHMQRSGVVHIKSYFLVPRLDKCKSASLRVTKQKYSILLLLLPFDPSYLEALDDLTPSAYCKLRMILQKFSLEICQLSIQRIKSARRLAVLFSRSIAHGYYHLLYIQMLSVFV